MLQVLILIDETLWYHKVRQGYVLLEFERFDLAENITRIVDGLRNVLEQFIHLGLCLEVKLVIEESKTFALHGHIIIAKFFVGRRALLLACIDTKQNIMCVGVALIDIVRVI